MMIYEFVLSALVLPFWKEFKLITFDNNFVQNTGFSPKKLNLLLSFMTMLAIIIGLQAVGVILMSAILATPVVVVRQWTNRLWVMVILPTLSGTVSSVVGMAASPLVPKLPTDPVIMVCVSVIAVVNVLFAPGQGILHRLYRRRKDRILYKLGEGAPNGSIT